MWPEFIGRQRALPRIFYAIMSGHNKHSDKQRDAQTVMADVPRERTEDAAEMI
jgi:hypothetical protein